MLCTKYILNLLLQYSYTYKEIMLFVTSFGDVK